MGQNVWFIEEPGGEEPGGEFRKVEVPRPTVGANQILVRISASGVNPLALREMCHGLQNPTCRMPWRTAVGKV
jgi:NADPH:quinone reductase-like Zn-dependent oxidoreductase